MNDTTRAHGSIRTRAEGAVRVLTIDRPDKKNAFSLAMYTSLAEQLSDADADATVRAVLLAGAGGVFTAGNDLGDFLASPPAGEESPVVRLLFRLADLAKPLVVAVDGPAVGIGTTLLLHADYVAASMRARFQLPFAALGVTPEAGSSLLLPLVVGLPRATEWLLLGEPFDAAAAKEAGLVNAVVPAEDLSAFALSRARAIADRPPGAVLAAKHLLREPIRAQVKDAIRREGQVFQERVRSPEAVAAIRAFVEKRSR
jgi:enoyl-CoA hydratase/carnithine racemase